MEQTFYVTVRHDDNPFSCIGNVDTVEFGNWFETARRLSVQYPKATVHCGTVARVRRVYRNGQLVREFTEWPYDGTPATNGCRW